MSPFGYVYFIRNESTGLIKIGFSRYPEQRRRTLQQVERADLTILATVAATQQLESTLHRLLASWRQRGEWFAPSEVLTTCIELARQRPARVGPPHYHSDPAVREHWFSEALRDDRMLARLIASFKAIASPCQQWSSLGPVRFGLGVSQ